MSENKQLNIGVVKWFDSQKGYGFLTNCVDNTDVFVHFSGIVSEENEFKVLCDGEYVSYNEGTMGDGKKVAVDVTGVYGGKLLSQNGKRVVFLPQKKKSYNSGDTSSPHVPIACTDLPAPDVP